MKLNPETKEKELRTSGLQKLLLIVGGGILTLIMIDAMKDGYALQQTGDDKSQMMSSAPAMPVSADTLQTEYAINADSTEMKYKDKLVLIKGVIAEVDKYRTGESYVIFQRPEQAKGVKLQCAFKKESAVDSLSKGQVINVKGTLNFTKDAIVVENSQLKHPD